MELAGKTFEKYIDNAEIIEIVSRIAHEIDEEYLGKDLVIIGVLNGAFPFLSDLAPRLKSKYQVHFTKYSSYAGTESTGVVRQELEVDIDLSNSHVLVVEDIVDTGNTLLQILADLSHHKPRSLRVASLLLKPEIVSHDLSIDFVGKEIPDHFVLGYGMDIDGLGRELKDIYRLV